VEPGTAPSDAVIRTTLRLARVCVCVCVDKTCLREPQQESASVKARALRETPRLHFANRNAKRWGG
jgi:hypothetical protein